MYVIGVICIGPIALTPRVFGSGTRIKYRSFIKYIMTVLDDKLNHV